MTIIYCYGENPLADSYAKESAEALTGAYPGHSWWVECRGGCLIIKHFELSGARGIVGMVRHTSKLDHSADRRKKEVIRAAGELMERAGIPRGADTGQRVIEMELEKGQQKFWTPVIH